jgi:hypothetical protein
MLTDSFKSVGGASKGCNSRCKSLERPKKAAAACRSSILLQKLFQLQLKRAEDRDDICFGGQRIMKQSRKEALDPRSGEELECNSS